MCKCCEVLKHYELKSDIYVKTKYWEYSKETNDSLERENWATIMTDLPVNYCPECGNKLK